MNKDRALKDLMYFLSIEGITGHEKQIAASDKQTLIESNVPEEYIFFDKFRNYIKFRNIYCCYF